MADQETEGKLRSACIPWYYRCESSPDMGVSLYLFCRGMNSKQSCKLNILDKFQFSESDLRVGTHGGVAF